MRDNLFKNIVKQQNVINNNPHIDKEPRQIELQHSELPFRV